VRFERMSRMVKVRFHLARGANFKTWQVIDNGVVRYYDPDAVCLRMFGCRLKNRRRVADKIFAGEDKTVCAWIDCERVEVGDSSSLETRDNQNILSFNPKVVPYWVRDGECAENLDGMVFSEIISRGRRLIVI